MFDAPEFIEESIQQLKATIDDVAIIACSGGVDSTVAAVIANKAVGNLLHCVYVDTGFMRKNETEEIEAMLAQQGINLITVKAADRYFEALKGVTEPEQKRKVIGELFIRIFEDEQKKCGAKYLVQGTIAPDWIESGGGVRDTIKSHHNVGGLPEDMTLEVVEPLRELYKDEVRELARELDIIVAERQPFPHHILQKISTRITNTVKGGLAVRTLGELTPERVEVVREACAIVEEEFEAGAEAGEMELPWQYFAALLPGSLGRCSWRCPCVWRNDCCSCSTKHGRNVCKIFGDSTPHSSEDQYANHKHGQRCSQSGRLRYYPQTTGYNRMGIVRSLYGKKIFGFIPRASCRASLIFCPRLKNGVPMPKAGCNSKWKKETEQDAENSFGNH